jgi:hypothetical protein
MGTIGEGAKDNDGEMGRYLLPSCFRDHQVGEPILFYGNPASPLGSNNSRRVQEGATLRNGISGNKGSSTTRGRIFLVKRKESKRERERRKICRRILRDEIHIAAYILSYRQYMSKGVA